MTPLREYYRYCPWSMLDAALALGWAFSAELGHHSEHSVLLEWQCDCPPRWPA